MAIVEESYAEFSKRVHGRAAGKRIPVNVDYDVTYRCNLNCRHCYCNLPANDREAKEKELKLDEIERILTEARDLGAFWILLTGGEPLVRPDFREIYLTALRLGLIPSVFTNGTLVDEEWAGFFAKYRPFKIEVTLYGSTPEVYERVTRAPGSFERCMRGIRLLKERGLPLSLKTMVLRSNRDDLDGIRALADSLAPSFRLDPILHARYPDLPLRGDVDPREERIPVEEVLRVDREDPAREGAWLKDCPRLLALGPPSDPDRVGCGAGRLSCHIGPDGTTRPCSLVRSVGWDAGAVGFREVWLREMPSWLSAPRSLPGPCLTCRLFTLCNQCDGWSQIEGGGEDREPGYVCSIAHLRATSFGTEGREDGHEAKASLQEADRHQSQARME